MQRGLPTNRAGPAGRPQRPTRASPSDCRGGKMGNADKTPRVSSVRNGRSKGVKAAADFTGAGRAVRSPPALPREPGGQHRASPTQRRGKESWSRGRAPRAAERRAPRVPAGAAAGQAGLGPQGRLSSQASRGRRHAAGGPRGRAPVRSAPGPGSPTACDGIRGDEGLRGRRPRLPSSPAAFAGRDQQVGRCSPHPVGHGLGTQGSRTSAGPQEHRPGSQPAASAQQV